MRSKKSQKSDASFPYPSPTRCEADLFRARKAGAAGHIIHKNRQTEKLIRDRLERLGLIPPTMNYDSEMNTLPSSLLSTEPGLSTAFETDLWTVYPCEQTLLHCISLEEHLILQREKLIWQGNPDPGRRDYNHSYATFPPLSVYDVWQLSEIPHQLDDYLPLNVNIVVRMKTGVLAKILSKDKSLDRRSLELGRYLMTLWDSTPKTFRSKHRPSCLQALPSPPLAPPLSIELGDDDSPFHNENSTSPSRYSLGSISFTSHTSTSNSSSSACVPNNPPNSSLPPSQHQQKSRHKVVPRHLSSSSSNPYRVLEQGSSGRFTSNEWALVCFGIELGGPVWNYDPGVRSSSRETVSPEENNGSWWDIGCVVS